jgi:hypothetical protein
MFKHIVTVEQIPPAQVVWDEHDNAYAEDANSIIAALTIKCPSFLFIFFSIKTP